MMFDFLKNRQEREKKGQGSRGVSRTQFLRGDVSGKNRPLRPPWALEEFDFTETCTRCGKCIEICPEKILLEGGSKFPVVEFKRGECTFCEECVTCCEPKALRFASDANHGEPWSLEVRVSHTCIAQKGVVCQICGDQCLERVFRFRPRVGGAVQMEMDMDKCSGCGACIAPCPVDALTLHHRQPVTEKSIGEHDGT